MVASASSSLKFHVAHAVAPFGSAAVVNSRRSNVYFFLDFSNIAISASQLTSERGDGRFARSKLRLHAENLRRFVERDRMWQRGFAAAGLLNQRSAIKDHFEQFGIEFEICERGQVTGREQNVDQRIRMEMLELLDSEQPTGTIVLATGDGSGFQEKRGFIKTLSILHQQGFSIEVMSWRHSLNGNLRDWATEHGRVIELDDFYEELTFVPGQRSATDGHRLFGKLARRRVI